MIRDGKVGVGLLALLALLMVVVGAQTIAAADAVVGTGTPESCTEAAFDSALATAQSGGGTVTFNCGGPATIQLTSVKSITGTVAIIATEPITFEGDWNAGLYFRIAQGQTIELEGLTIFKSPTGTRGYIDNYGTAIIRNCAFLGEAHIEAVINNNPRAHMSITNSVFSNIATFRSIIDNNGFITITESIFSNIRTSEPHTSIIYNIDGITNITNSVFEDTDMRNGENYIIVSNSPLFITNSHFRNNKNPTRGLIISNDRLDIVGSTFENNGVYDYSVAGVLESISPKQLLTITSSTFKNNKGLMAGAIYVSGPDSGENMYPKIAIENTRFINNMSLAGGAISAKHTDIAISNNSLFQGNIAYYGGAIYTRNSLLSIQDTRIQENQHATLSEQLSKGGGIFSVRSRLDLENTAMISNTAYQGGSIFVSGTEFYRPQLMNHTMDTATIPLTMSVRITNSTLSGNSAAEGAGLYIDAGVGLTMTHTTIADNLGAGLHHVDTLASQVTVANSIIAGNSGGACSGGQLTALTGTLWDDTSCAAATTSANQPNTDPQLAPLALFDNTLAHMPQATSPAIDAAACPATVTHDQRGLARPQGWNCDLGAIETTIIKERIFLPAILR